MNAKIIPMTVLQARRAEVMSGEERESVRRLLHDFETYRNACPTALNVTGEMRLSTDRSPLTSSEIQSIRTMLEEFAQIQRSCPTARRVFDQ